MDGLYFALPTRAAASQMYGRLTHFIAGLFPEEVGPEPVLAVPGYVRASTATGKYLPKDEVGWDDHPDIRSALAFLAGRVHLYRHRTYSPDWRHVS